MNAFLKAFSFCERANHRRVALDYEKTVFEGKSAPEVEKITRSTHNQSQVTFLKVFIRKETRVNE